MAAKLNYPSRDQHPVEGKSPLDLPYAASVAATDLIVVITDPTGTPITKVATIATLGGGGSGSAGSVGTGSPEASVTASPGTMYLDDATDSLWIKRTGVGNTGWLQLQ